MRWGQVAFLLKLGCISVEPAAAAGVWGSIILGTRSMMRKMMGWVVGMMVVQMILVPNRNINDSTGNTIIDDSKNTSNVNVCTYLSLPGRASEERFSNLF